ncbi:LuxR C-terminal-related transcriptional regulator [Paraburkholderia sediminicola]|uniref:LuxR C-terminal-related transcriptional regulator n=1 Tax=Paraburkholderia rhynchosiae TaxID=487049 RepID=A0ACC7NC46_9BURK
MESAIELVYVVDDDRRVREALFTLLRANGKDVQAFDPGAEFLDTRGHASSLQARYQSLTPRKQELMPLLASGLLNKQVAENLGITEYTVQIHRGHIMKKMRASSFSTLGRQASKLQLETPSTLMFEA